MTKVWTTKEGVEIEYSKLEDSHLLNIIKFVKKRAKELDGSPIAGGSGSEAGDMWGEVGEEEDFLISLGYYDLLEEAKKRKLK